MYNNSPLCRKPFGGINANQLRGLAMFLMLLDHLWATLIPGNIWMTYLGRLAFPIFAFQISEGFSHTSDRKRYAKRLFLFGLLSEVPFDMAFFKTPFHWGNQNVYWTLAMGVLAMALLQKSEDADGNAAWTGCLAALACAVVAQLAGTDYGAIGVALIVALYLTRNDRRYQCIIGAGMMLFEITAPLVFVLLWLYNGERGRCPQWAKWAFYGFYPVHLTLLALVTNLLLA